jgi:hypothetical protein
MSSSVISRSRKPWWSSRYFSRVTGVAVLVVEDDGGDHGLAVDFHDVVEVVVGGADPEHSSYPICERS